MKPLLMTAALCIGILGVQCVDPPGPVEDGMVTFPTDGAQDPMLDPSADPRVDDETLILTPRDARSPFIPNSELAYIDAIVPHHHSGIEMAQIEIERGGRAEVVAIAQRIVNEHTADISFLLSARQTLTGTSAQPAPLVDSHMLVEMAELEAIASQDIDRRFLEQMIAHHATGIVIAHRAGYFLLNGDLRQNALDVVDQQATDIGEMHTMLHTLFGGGEGDPVE